MHRLTLASLLLCASTLVAQVTPAPATNAHPYTVLYDGHPSTAAHRVVGDMLYQEAISKAP